MIYADEIISIASGLKSKVGGVKEIFNQELVAREASVKKVRSRRRGGMKRNIVCRAL